ncbi:MAG TPA: hypothetical protein VE866_15275 [Candidatus Binatia bacterium]|nr:hypothetical protein [Candidatus Binatia bacterium]
MDIERIERWVNLALRLEIHALILLAIGAALCFKGQHDEGQLVIGGALGIFRGRSN